MRQRSDLIGRWLSQIVTLAIAEISAVAIAFSPLLFPVGAEPAVEPANRLPIDERTAGDRQSQLPVPLLPTVNLDALVLLPDRQTADWLEAQFEANVAILNDRITRRQAMLQDLLMDADSHDDRIRQVQSILSQLRTARDRLAIEHLLLIRKLSPDGTLPAAVTPPPAEGG
ncbi:hypothetical protein [Synechococcus sp. PCC 7336]|uniref:hypothetical protein n=1 Tax=Synechococcus sp. PCC 7336 TaxID=195250 RepID=UPI000684B91B|nr:hypothetical protein [Synechococcus sp. PCC 7336]